MTEEGLPFLILFYNPEHTEIKQVFRERVHEELIHEKGIALMKCLLIIVILITR